MTSPMRVVKLRLAQPIYKPCYQRRQLITICLCLRLRIGRSIIQYVVTSYRTGAVWIFVGCNNYRELVVSCCRSEALSKVGCITSRSTMKVQFCLQHEDTIAPCASIYWKNNMRKLHHTVMLQWQKEGGAGNTGLDLTQPVLITFPETRAKPSTPFSPAVGFSYLIRRRPEITTVKMARISLHGQYHTVLCLHYDNTVRIIANSYCQQLLWTKAHRVKPRERSHSRLPRLCSEIHHYR
ncbi:hypothetical protein F5Y12DRAFT_112829 [Xylaria sp. FL1777]|nr:hypothetical protein F5Y12DRAFT_112829 [Xylaria sp. FL1777]